MDLYDYLIVGAGLFGATFARLATDRGYRCLVIDRRDHMGGNIACESIEGINVHRYGPHIFHTSSREVWDFVTSHARFADYHHSPLAVAPDGRSYSLPFSMYTFRQLWGVDTAEGAGRILDEQRREVRDRLAAEGITEPRNLEEQALLMVGHDIYELLVKGYTEKQWGRRCIDLPPFIIRRLPLRMTFDDRYFNDTFQAMPVGGYNPLVKALLQGSDVRLGVDFFAGRGQLTAMARNVVFTGRIDEYFDYEFGRLQYRSVRFESEILDRPDFQGRAVINYTDRNVPFTRIVEHKHFEPLTESDRARQHTVITREYSDECAHGAEPAYPVNDERNMRIFDRYRDKAALEKGVIFGGRLAEYKYYDMAPVIEKAMNLWK